MNIVKRISKPIFYSVKTRTKRALNIPIKPRMIEFDVTKYCNSRCKYCDIWHGQKKGEQLTLEQIEKAFLDPFMSDVETIIITGGEPTLRNDLKEIYSTLHKSCPKATLQLSTNGIMKERALIITKWALEQGMKFDVGISLDGIGKDHDEIRGVPGNFKSVNKLIDDLIKLKKKYPKQLKICLGMTISDLTVNKYPALKRYAKKKGLELEYAWVEQTPYYDNQNKDIHITKNKIIDIVKDLPGTPRKEMWLKDINKEPIKFNCYALRTFFVLKYNGDIAPCLHYYNHTIGNIKTQSFRQIFTGKKAEELRKNLIKNCSGCLNTWAYAESNMAQLTPYIKYYIRNPKAFIKELKRNR